MSEARNTGVLACERTVTAAPTECQRTSHRQDACAPWVRLGDYIEPCDERNSDGRYGVDDACGMTITKEIIPTRANLAGTDLSKFLVVNPEEFVYNPRTHGKRIGLGFNDTDKPLIISWNNAAFKVKDKEKVVPKYLYLYFSRLEWDREACYCSWGTSTEVFSWEELCRMRIPLPSIEVQRELVAVYEGLKGLAQENEAMLQPLSEACHAFIADCKRKYPAATLGEYIEECDERNSDGRYGVDDVRGISNQKQIIDTKADMNGVSLLPYKIMKPEEFCYVTVTSRNGGRISLTMNNTPKPYIVSSSYITFRSKDKEKLLPEYLFLLLSRSEFDRYARFNSWGSARETFDWAELCRMRIPLPDKDVQAQIVALYHCYDECKRIASEAREQLKTICPALIRYATEKNAAKA